MMKVVIIEDEMNAFEYLSTSLQQLEPGLNVVFHGDSVKSAVNYFQESKAFDLIFLDIQLADGISFEIFNHINISKPIIFTTAYDEYALQAFKLHSIDYLLKPIHKSDLKNALDKYKEVYSQKSFLPEDLKQILGPITKNKKNRCLVKKGGHFEYVNVDDIAFVNSEDSLTFLHTFSNQRFIYSKTVEQLFDELDRQQFYQINRSQIVNSQAIKEIHPYLNQRLKLNLVTTTENKDFIVSRNKMTSFKLWMDQ